jgi:papain like cysteine protease AvrRpt2
VALSRARCWSDHTDLVNLCTTEWSKGVDVDRGDAGLDAKSWSIQLGRLGPIGCSIDGVVPGTAHCVVLIGAYGDQGHVVIHDPWRGPRLSMSTDSFNGVLSYYTWPPVRVGPTLLTARGAHWAR